MTLTPGLFTVLFLSSTLTAPRCDAEHILHQLPPPTEVSYKWLSEITVKLSWSWQRPSTLPKECDIRYFVGLVEDSNPSEYKCQTMGTEKSYTSSCLIEEVDSDHWNYTVRAIAYSKCSGWNNSTDATKTVESKKPRAELLKSFECMFGRDGIKCSWIPLNATQNLTLFYWECGKLNADLHLKACGQPYSSGERPYCILNCGIDICFLVNTSSEWKVFRSPIGTKLPPLNITEDKSQLILTWPAPDPNNCSWMYEFSYTECNKHQQGQNKTLEHFQREMTATVPYNKDCHYKFKYRVLTTNYCLRIVSKWNENVTYGTTANTHDGTLTFVAIIIPIIVFVIVILSCYCFRKYSSIICPNTPDPSAIFKEMVMDGNKEHKTENLYTPKPEQSCKVTLISQSGELQRNP